MKIDELIAILLKAKNAGIEDVEQLHEVMTLLKKAKEAN